jgi:methionine sulfoxide reductase heme-binding subunit
MRRAPPRSARFRRRLLRQHVPLALASVAGIAVIFFGLPGNDPKFKLSMATAYTGLALLVGVLLLGPFRVLRREPNPVSTDLRRDLAIWAGAVSILHVAVGLFVHMGSPWLYFFYSAAEAEQRLVPLRRDAFGLANYTGLVATLVIVLLLALSNDLSLGALGSRRWKTLQRLSYVMFPFVIIHGLLYQQLEKRAPAWIVVVVLLALVVLAGQLAGVVRQRRRLQRHRRAP